MSKDTPASDWWELANILQMSLNMNVILSSSWEQRQINKSFWNQIFLMVCVINTICCGCYNRQENTYCCDHFMMMSWSQDIRRQHLTDMAEVKVNIQKSLEKLFTNTYFIHTFINVGLQEQQTEHRHSYVPLLSLLLQLL